MKLTPSPRSPAPDSPPAPVSSPTATPRLPEPTGADLRLAVSGLAKVLSRRATLPVLACVRIESVEAPGRGDRGRRLRFTATDLDLTLRLDLPAQLPPGHRLPEVAPFLLPLDRLRDLSKVVRPHEAIALGPVRGAPPLADWPVQAELHRAALAAATPIPIPDEVVTGLLRAFACASHDPARRVLQSALVDATGGGPSGHRVVGTDGRCLFSSNSFHLEALAESVVLPDHPLWTWKPLRESRPWVLRLADPAGSGTGGGAARPFRIEGPFWSVEGLSVEGSYPNYRQVIPREEEFRTRVDLPEPALRDLARMLPVLPGGKLPNRPVGLEIRGPEEVALLFRDTHEEPWEARPILGARAQGPAVTVFANRDPLGRAFGFGLGRVDLIDPLGPIRLSRGGDLMVVMPLRMPGQPEVNRPATPFCPIGAGPVPDPGAGAGAGAKAAAKAKPRPQPPQSNPKPNLNPNPPSQPMAPVPTPSPQPPAGATPPVDPLEAAESRLSDLRQTLDGARQGLVSVATALRQARQQRHKTQREIDAVRSTLRSLQRVDL